MIKTFADKDTKDLYMKGKSKGFPPDLARRAIRKFAYLDSAIFSNAYDVEITDYH